MTDVEIFAMDGCHACESTEEYFKKLGIAYEKKSIIESQEALKLFEGKPAIETPVIKICNPDPQSCEYLVGFNQSELDMRFAPPVEVPQSEVQPETSERPVEEGTL